MQRPPTTRGGSKALTAFGLIIFVGVVATYPVLYATKGPRLSDKALSGDAIIRGAYINTGSRDAGPDPRAGNYKSDQ